MVPEVFGKYVLLERLGVGGMGEVVLAKAGTQGFERYFAIKRILTQGREDDAMVAMLISEAKLTISLVHPNIAQVFEFGKVGNHFFLAMEYVEGLSLSQVLAAAAAGEAELRAADAVSCVIQVCRALDYAHEKRDSTGSHLGVVHRDISPQNVLVDTSGLVKLIDFGVAKAASNVNKTGAGFLKGKIGYMSPEQATAGVVDRRSDIYSVGVVLYEALTLHRMFGGDDPLRVLMKVQTNQLPPIDKALGGKVPATLIAALKKALSTNPDDRHATAGELERDLSRALSEIDPAYTAHDLAKLVREVDTEFEARSERFKSYSKISPAEILAGQGSPELVGGEPTVKPGSGSGVTRLPATSDDLDFSISVEPRRASRRGLVLGLLGAVVAAGVGAGLVWYQPWRSPPPATRTILVDSTPIAARVLVDGELKGLTPATLTGITVAEVHRLRVEKDGFEAEERVLEAGTSATVSLRFELKPIGGEPAAVTDQPEPTPDKPAARPPRNPPRPPAKTEKGCLSVMVHPWAYINVDGERVGQTPQQCIKLPAGKHKVTLSNPALGVNKELTVTVKGGQTTAIKERF